MKHGLQKGILEVLESRDTPILFEELSVLFKSRDMSTISNALTLLHVKGEIIVPAWRQYILPGRGYEDVFPISITKDQCAMDVLNAYKDYREPISIKNVQELLSKYSHKQIEYATQKLFGLKKIVKKGKHYQYEEKKPVENVKPENVKAASLQQTMVKASELNVQHIKASTMRSEINAITYKLGKRRLHYDFSLVLCFGKAIIEQVGWKELEKLDLDWDKNTKIMKIEKSESGQPLQYGDGRYCLLTPIIIGHSFPKPVSIEDKHFREDQIFIFEEGSIKLSFKETEVTFI